MKYLFIEYPKCGTCQKAKRWLDNNNITYDDRHIVENNPTAHELKIWIEESNLPIKKFFNTSGILYKELNLKDKLSTLSEDEQIAILASSGMLVKRPLIIGKELILVGFNEKEWEQLKK